MVASSPVQIDALADHADGRRGRSCLRQLGARWAPADWCHAPRRSRLRRSVAHEVLIAWARPGTVTEATTKGRQRSLSRTTECCTVWC